MEKIIKGNERINSSSGRPCACARVHVRNIFISVWNNTKAFRAHYSAGAAPVKQVSGSSYRTWSVSHPVKSPSVRLPAELQRRRTSVSERMSVNE